MAKTEDRWIGGSKYTVAKGTRSDWKPGQAFNISTPVTSPSKPSGYTPAAAPVAKPVMQQQPQYQPQLQPRPQYQQQPQYQAQQQPQYQFPQWPTTPASTYTPMNESEMLRLATQYGDLQVNPLVEALQRQKELSELDTQAQQGSIEASYSGVPVAMSRMLKDAMKNAQESAIARGVGRSGPTEWLYKEASEPILERGETLEREKADKLINLANRRKMLSEHTAQELKSLAGKRGDIVSQKLAALRDQALGLGRQDAATAFNQELQKREMELRMAEYMRPSAQTGATLLSDATKTMGASAPSQAMSPVPGAMVGLRDWLSSRNVPVGYDEASQNVSIGNRSFSPEALRSGGGRLVNDRWVMPESWMSRYWGG